jgi:hypothetical protein
MVSARLDAVGHCLCYFVHHSLALYNKSTAIAERLKINIAGSNLPNGTSKLSPKQLYGFVVPEAAKHYR